MKTKAYQVVGQRIIFIIQKTDAVREMKQIRSLYARAFVPTHTSGRMSFRRRPELDNIAGESPEQSTTGGNKR